MTQQEILQEAVLYAWDIMRKYNDEDQSIIYANYEGKSLSLHPHGHPAMVAKSDLEG